MRKWLSEGVIGLLFLAGIFAFMGFCAVISWPILKGFSALTESFFIPYAPATYQHLSGAAGNFPASILGIASIPFTNTPNSFIAFAWAFALGVQILNLKNDWADLPAKHRKGQSRGALIQKLWRLKLKHCAIYSAILLVLCLPGLRCYQIVTKDAIRYLDYFSLQEKSLPLSALENIERYQYGRANGLIGWNFTFKNGTVLDVNAPNLEALKQLLALPNVSANVALRDGKLYQK
jgi:hypothetical protein